MSRLPNSKLVIPESTKEIPYTRETDIFKKKLAGTNHLRTYEHSNCRRPNFTFYSTPKSL